MITAIYPGSFDPVTNGHYDIIQRASGMFDKLIVGVLINSSKKPLFTMEERIEQLELLTKDFDNVEIRMSDGLLIDFAHQVGAKVIVRGLRAVTDFDYELQLAQMNRVIAPDVDTVFLATNLKYSYLSSSLVKEIASYQGDISAFVDPRIAEKVREKYDKSKGVNA